MSFLDLLNNGADIPAGSAVTATDTTTSGPAWWTDVLKGILAKQDTVGNTPYATFPGERVAGVTPDMATSYGMTRDAAGAYKPGLATAQDLVNKGAGTSAAAAANPYLTGANATITSGLNQPTGMAAGQPGFTGGVNAIQGGLNQQGGLDAANPYLAKAAGDVTDVSAYMNPYQDAVVNRIAELGQRNLNEKIMPGLEGRYIKAGQFRGSGQMTDTARAVRDTSADILAAQSSALQQGYNAAQTAKGTDLSRYGTLGATAANAAGTDRSTTIQGGTAMGNLGTNMASAANADRSTTIQGGTAQGNLGATASSAAGTDATNLLNAGKTTAGIAADTQNLGLAGANAVNAAGVQERGINQENDTAAYEEWMRQQGYPQEQINAAVNTMKGIQPSAPTNVTTQGIVPNGNTAVNPTTASTIASLLSGAGGVLAGIKGI